MGSNSRWPAQMLAAILENLPDPLLVVDSLGNVVLRNKASRVMTGVPADEPLNVWDRNNMTIWYEDGRPVAREDYPMRRLLRGLPLPKQRFRAEARDGRRLLLEAEGVRIPPQGPPDVCLVTYRDAGVFHEEPDSRQDLLRAVSHDLRSPLSIVSAQCQLLLRSLQEENLVVEARRAADILRTTERMNLMIDDLSETIRAESGVFELKKERVDLVAVVKDLIDRMAVLAESRVVLSMPPSPIMVSGDGSRIERCVQNLVVNALRYSAAPLPVDVVVHADGAWAIVDVKDRGPGIDQADKPRIFRRFFRGRAAAGSEGLGLGLYNSRITAESHGGSISVESSPGEGSTFTLRLPAS